jgi:hypothetical protein
MMRWWPVVLLLVAIAIAVIVAGGLPEDTGSTADVERERTPVDVAASAAAPARSE